MIELEVTDYTLRPVDAISEAAGTSYGKTDSSYKRMATCFERGHMSVFEFAYITVRIKGISRACSHQLVRHRHASFVQKSQRYTTIRDNDWYVVPPSIEQPERSAFEQEMGRIKGIYEVLLREGVKPEDARFILPEATKTELTMSMNVRELFHFLDLRCDKAAQWEIRELAEGIKDAAWALNDGWQQVIELWEEKHAS